MNSQNQGLASPGISDRCGQPPQAQMQTSLLGSAGLDPYHCLQSRSLPFSDGSSSSCPKVGVVCCDLKEVG